MALAASTSSPFNARPANSTAPTRAQARLRPGSPATPFRVDHIFVVGNRDPYLATPATRQPRPQRRRAFPPTFPASDQLMKTEVALAVARPHATLPIPYLITACFTFWLSVVPTSIAPAFHPPHIRPGLGDNVDPVLQSAQDGDRMVRWGRVGSDVEWQLRANG